VCLAISTFGFGFSSAQARSPPPPALTVIKIDRSVQSRASGEIVEEDEAIVASVISLARAP